MSDNRALRTTLVTQWFPPEPTRIPLGIATALRRAGLDLQVLTGVPNFPEGKVHDGYSAGGFSREKIAGFKVQRTPLYPYHGSSAIRRMANYLSWAFSSLVAAFWVLRKQDVVLVYSSPATAVAPALLAKFLYRTPFVLLIEDLWPDSVTATGYLATRKWAFVRTVLNSFVQFTYRHAAHVVVISPSMQAELVARGVPSDRISLMYNWVDEPGVASDAPTPDFRVAADFVVMYGGNLGRAQALETAIHAVAAQEDLGIHLVLAGDGLERETLEVLANRVAPGRVHFTGRLPQDEYRSLMDSSDIQLVSLKKDRLFEMTFPSKVQSILSVGKPLIVSAGGDVASVVVEAGAGWAVSSGDVSALASAFAEAATCTAEELRAIGQAGEEYYRDRMSEQVGARILVDVLVRAGAR